MPSFAAPGSPLKFRLGGLLVLACAGAVAAPAADTLEQRVIPCVDCHGDSGRDLESGYVPRIHGKPAGYLYNPLVNFREGRRYNHAMALMVGHLSDDYLAEIAQYFATAHAPYREREAPAASPAQLSRGLELAMRGDRELGIPACTDCHGEKLTGVSPSTPGLIGLPHFYIMAQLGAWRAGTRQAAVPDCMREIAERLSGNDTLAVAAWLASRPIPPDPNPAAGAVGEPPMECGSLPEAVAHD